MVFPAKRGMRYALFKTQIERTTFKIILIINSLKAYIASHFPNAIDSTSFVPNSAKILSVVTPKASSSSTTFPIKICIS